MSLADRRRQPLVETAPAVRSYARGRETTYLLLLAGALLLGSLLRIVFWWQQSRFGVVPPVSDEEEYFRGAVHLFRNGTYYDAGQWLRAPGPSLLLALCFALVGGVRLPHALALQAIISGLAVLPIAATARSLFVSRRAGLVAGLVTAIYLPFALSAGQLMSEAAAILTIALTAWTLERWRATDNRRWLFASGMALAAFTLTRAVGLYAQAIVAGWVWWRAQPSVRRLRILPPGVLRSAALFLLAFWIVLAPWSIRNALIYEQPVLVDTNAGFSFWSGTDDPADRVALQVEWNERFPDSASRQSAYMERALANIRRDSLAWIGAMPSKVVTLWQPRIRTLISNGLYTLVPAQLSAPLTLLGDLQYVALALTTIASLAFVRRPQPHWFLILWPLYGSALSAVSLGHPRLRIPFEVSLIVLGAYPLAHPRRVWRAATRSPRRWQIGAITAMLGFGLLIYSSVYLGFLRSQTQLLAASVWSARGDRQNAIRATEAAVQAQPGSALPLMALAERQLAAGDPAGITTWEQVREIDDQIVSAHAALLREALRREDQNAILANVEAIRTIRREDNRLFAWLWEQNVREPRSNLAIDGVSDLGLIQGVDAPQTVDGTTFRWTHEKSDLRLPAGDRSTLRLQLRGWHPNQTVDVLTDGQPIGECGVALDWQTCAVALPASAQPRVVTLRAAVAVPWPPDDYLPRGVAIARATIE